MSLRQELEDLGAPRDVLDAADRVASAAKPDRELVAFIQRWVARHRQQDRYGK